MNWMFAAKTISIIQEGLKIYKRFFNNKQINISNVWAN